jgi:hypothetical protein
MFRRLSAIEIAEGALLADITVIFNLLTLYLPIGGDVFRLLIFIVFALLVLRRGLYAGIMGLCVALFLTAVLSGINFIPIMLLEGTGGLFLGVTMKHRWHHLPLLFVGITCGAASLFILIVLSSLLFGIPLSTFIISLHKAYTAALGLVNLITASIGLSNFWKQNIFPLVSTIANLAFTYWLAGLYLTFWLGLCPVVAGIYYLTGLFVRLLGYEVRPFPGGGLQKLLRWLARTLARWVGKSPLGKYPATRTLLKQIRMYIGRI